MEEILINERQHIANCLGMIDYDHFIDFKNNAVAGMSHFGDSFIRALAEALRVSTDENAVKIIRIWSNEIGQCEMMQRIKVSKQRALQLEGIPNCT